MNIIPRLRSVLLGALMVFVGLPAVRAQETVCARVVIKIEQQLTLERQGFVASMGITNGLPVSLDNFRVVLNFTDENGNAVAVSTDAEPNANGRFYYRLQTGFTAPASVGSGASQNVAYFIVPTVGAAGTSANGALYYVGATVTYSTSGQSQTVQVIPAPITVQPMPELQLQYFLPGDVYGDDPLTPNVQEAVVPFALGVRVTNHSAYAPARKVNIQSSQPEIVENDNGLLIDFRIISSEVNGGAALPTLLANFGDIAPRRASVGNWSMTASLSGKFVKFLAQISHAPDLGGNLTSLIPESAISTHRLLGQVVVDLPGRDSILDFLATNSMTGDVTSAQVYESDNDNVNEAVDYYAPGAGSVALSSLSAARTATLSLAPGGTLVYIKTASPIALDQKVVAIRSDGKTLPAANAWISKTRDRNNAWVYWLNLFDTGKPSAASYALRFSDPLLTGTPPVLVLPGAGPLNAQVNRLFKLAVSATDADGTIPALSTGALPDGAVFLDARTGRGDFTWTPTIGQVGSYTVQFRASDGSTTVTKNLVINVVATSVSGFAAWQDRWWPGVTDPAIIGSNANPSGDRITNLMKYALDGDPTMADDALLPTVGSTVIDGQRYLTLTFAQRTDDEILVYEVVASSDLTADGSTWTVQTQVVSTGTPDLLTGMQTVTVRDSVPFETGPIQRYLRLRVTAPNAP
jgi:hypothetical protein